MHDERNCPVCNPHSEYENEIDDDSHNEGFDYKRAATPCYSAYNMTQELLLRLHREMGANNFPEMEIARACPYTVLGGPLVGTYEDGQLTVQCENVRCTVAARPVMNRELFYTLRSFIEMSHREDSHMLYSHVMLGTPEEEKTMDHFLRYLQIYGPESQLRTIVEKVQLPTP
jgi:hypothetical protein